MLLLAVDTATVLQSVAVADDGRVVAETRLFAAPGQHSRRLVPAVAFLLETLGAGPRDLGALAVVAGPGSFTGLRVGISAIQGIALPGELPCVALGTLDVMARTPVVAAAGGGRRPIVVAVDAYRGQVYAAVYAADGALVAAPRAETPAELVARLPEDAVLAGEGALAHRAALAAAKPGVTFVPDDLYLAATAARLAAARVAAGETVPASALRPLYLRPADVGAARPV